MVMCALYFILNNNKSLILKRLKNVAEALQYWENFYYIIVQNISQQETSKHDWSSFKGTGFLNTFSQYANIQTLCFNPPFVLGYSHFHNAI